VDFTSDSRSNAVHMSSIKITNTNTSLIVGWDSSLGIANCYGLDRPGIKSHRCEIFPHPSTLALGPTQPSVQWVLGLSQGWSSRGMALTTHRTSSAEVKERVELYLYSPSGPLWPVLRWSLSLISFSSIMLPFDITQCESLCIIDLIEWEWRNSTTYS
jgi:hypothetical protein